MKALLYTSDPYEPSGVIGLFETEEQKQKILFEHRKEWERLELPNYKEDNKFYPWLSLERRLQEAEKDYKEHINALEEIEIPIGVYGQYY